MPWTHAGAPVAGPHQGDRDAEADRSGPRSLTADDVVPRLVGLGMSLDDASQLDRSHPEQHVRNALDALEELDAKRRVPDPIAWVDAAVKQRWDLSALLAERRLREQRLVTLETDRQQRDLSADAYPTWRAIADRWDAAISAALDEDQLARAVDALTSPLAGLSRHSVPVARAELVTWAVAVHGRHPQTPLRVALAADLDHGPAAAEPCPWPLPEPPADDVPDQAPTGLGTRLAAALAPEVGESLEVESDLEVEVPSPVVRTSQDLA